MPEAQASTAGGPAAIGRYSVVRRLGEGGQGVVYLARSPQGQLCAVKVLRADWLADPDARRRLAREVAAATHVAAFCTARVLEAQLDGDQPFVVTEYVEGPTLTEQVRQFGPVGGSDLHRLAIGTATAVTAIHVAGVVHRDLKPSNVILGPQGPRVIDFGIARDQSSSATLTGQVIGTPMFMAPEQVHGSGVGPPADIFAWACTLAFAATGRSPFGTGPVPAVMYRVVNEAPDLSGVEPWLAGLLRSCLAKDAAQRPTAQQVLFGLLGLASQAPAAPATADAAALLTMGAAATSAVAAAPTPPPAPPPPPPPAAPAHGTPAFPAAMPQRPLPAGAGPYPPPPPMMPTATAPGLATRTAAPAAPWAHRTLPAPPRRNRRRVVVPITIGLAVLVVVGVAVWIGLTYKSSPHPPNGLHGRHSAPPGTRSVAGNGAGASAGTGSAAGSPAPSTAQGGQGVPAAYAGTWYGELRANGDVTTDVVLTLDQGSQVGQVRYPSSHCLGVVTVLDVGGGDSYLRLGETITSGTAQDCPSGQITLQVDGTPGAGTTTGLSMRWEYPGDPTSTETGSLHQQ